MKMIFLTPKSPERAENEETPENTSTLKCHIFQGFRVAAVGFEHPSDSPMNPAFPEQGGAESGVLCLSDPDLASVIDAWAFLPDAVKAGILAMVRAAKG